MHEIAISYKIHSAILDPHKLRAKVFIFDIELWNTADDPCNGNSSLYNPDLSKSFLMLLFGFLLVKEEQQVSEEGIHSSLECNPLSSSSLLYCLSFTNNRSSTHGHSVTETVLHFMSKDCMSNSVSWTTIYGFKTLRITQIYAGSQFQEPG